jgi:hypothetical protein
MEKQQYTVEDLSAHLFWDVAIEEVDLEQHTSFIMERVMRYGKLNDWFLVKKIYGLEQIKSIVVELRELDDFSIAFLSLILNIKKEAFRCYRQKQSQPSFWNY